MNKLRIFDPIGWEERRRELDSLRDQMAELLTRERELDAVFTAYSRRQPTNKANARRRTARKAVAR